MEHLGAEGTEGLGLAQAHLGNGSGPGDQAWVRREHAVHIGPDLHLVRIQGFPQQGGAGVGAASAQGGGGAFRGGTQEPLGDPQGPGRQGRPPRGRCCSQGREEGPGLAEAGVGLHDLPNFLEGGLEAVGRQVGREGLADGQGGIPAPGCALPQHGHAREQLVQAVEQRGPSRFHCRQVAQFARHLLVALTDGRQHRLGGGEVLAAGSGTGFQDAVRGAPEGRDHHEAPSWQLGLDDGGGPTQSIGTAHGTATEFDDLERHG